MKRLAAALLLASCTVGPDYRRPAAEVPGAFRGAAPVPGATAESLADLPWWQVFQDPALQGLVRDALARNTDLRAAVSRVEAARQRAEVAADALWPTIGAQASGTYTRGLGGSFSAGGTTASGGVGVPGAPSGQLAVLTQAATVSWDLDLWGRLRRAREAALAQLLATDEVRRGIIVSLVAEVASDYFRLLDLDQELAIAREQLEARRQTLELFRLREQGGVENGLAVAQAQASVAQAAALVPQIQQQIVATEDRLSLLLGRVPGPIARGVALGDQRRPPEVPAGLPAKLLERRPDVRQAEAQLMAANAQIGVAEAALLPDFTLTGRAGVAEIVLGPASGTSTFGQGTGVLTELFPFLGGAALRHQVGASRADWQAAVATWQGAVLNALAEVADALASVRSSTAVRQALEAQVAALRDAVALSRDRFVNGLANYLEVIEAQLSLLPAELQLSQARAAELTAIVTLYRTLGGGWATEEPRKKAQ